MSEVHVRMAEGRGSHPDWRRLTAFRSLPTGREWLCPCAVQPNWSDVWFLQHFQAEVVWDPKWALDWSVLESMFVDAP